MQRFNQRFIKRYEMREQDLRGEYMRKLDEVQRLDRELSSVVDLGKKEILKGELLRKEIMKSEVALEAAKMELRETHGEEIDVNLLLAYAKSFIQTLKIVWCDAPYAVKKKIQRFALPGAVSVIHSPSGYSFSNPGIRRLFKLIEEVGADQSNVVTPDLWKPNQIISDLVKLFDLFYADVKALGFITSQ